MKQPGWGAKLGSRGPAGAIQRGTASQWEAMGPPPARVSVTVRAPDRGFRRGGFSLLEMLVVCVVIGVGLLLMWGPAVRSQAGLARAACGRQLMQLHVALAMYAFDAGGRFPAVRGARTSEEPLSMLVPGYLSETRWFVCPGSRDAAPPARPGFTGGRVSFAYYHGLRTNLSSSLPLMSDEQVDGKAKEAGEVVFSTDGSAPGNNHGDSGGNVLFLDGSVRFTAPRAAFPLPLPGGVQLLNPRR